jgi:L-ascorbate 6-phosphate lactonase
MELNKNAGRAGIRLIEEMNQTSVLEGMLAVWFLGQESVVIKGGDTILYVDPYVSDLLEVQYGAVRTYPAPFTPQAITNAEFCLITHEHEDHLDAGTLSVMARNSPNTTYMAPAYCRKMLEDLGVRSQQIINARTGEWWSRGNLRIKPVPAAHEQLEEHPELGHRYVGYIIQLNGVTLYHAGDTTIYPGMVELLKAEIIDLGMLPINGRDAFRNAKGLVGNMDYREAGELASAAGFDTVIPLHYDVFAANSERPGYFVDYLYEHYPEQKTHVMARFERFIYVSPRACLRTTI